MDRMMPIDLERVDLRKRVRGYDPGQVHALLARVADEWETLHREVNALREEASRLASANADFRAREDTLKEALLLAQKAADETRANAHQEAERIVADARRKAAEDLRELRDQVSRLREERREFEAEFRHLLEGCLAKLDRPTLTLVDGQPVEARSVAV